MDFGDLLRGAAEQMGSASAVPSAEETADALIDFQPIKDLKVGDRIRWKAIYPNTMKGHEDWPVLTVARVLPPNPTMPKDGNRVKVYDFTWLERDTDGEIIEWAGESRLYERV